MLSHLATDSLCFRHFCLAVWKSEIKDRRPSFPVQHFGREAPLSPSLKLHRGDYSDSLNLSIIGELSWSQICCSQQVWKEKENFFFSPFNHKMREIHVIVTEKKWTLKSKASAELLFCLFKNLRHFRYLRVHRCLKGTAVKDRIQLQKKKAKIVVLCFLCRP